jgi:outer membrane protein TolC
MWNYGGNPIPGVTRDYNMGIGIAIPIFFPFNELAGMKAARRDVSNAEYQLESLRIQAVADLQTIYMSIQAAEREVDNLTRFVVPAAKASYELTLLTYSLGKADYFRLNESRRAWLDAERDLLTKRQNAAQLYNQLIAQVGCDFSRNEGPHACK